MEIKIFCMACKVEILRADTDTLRTPLIGNMFKVKKDMEWNLFSPHDTDKDLICPMCEWTFHEEGRVSVPVNGDFVIGKPEVIIPGIIACFMVTGILEKEKERLVNGDWSEKDEKAPEETKPYGGISSGRMVQDIQERKTDIIDTAKLEVNQTVEKKVDKVVEETKAIATEALYPTQEPPKKTPIVENHFEVTGTTKITSPEGTIHIEGKADKVVEESKIIATGVPLEVPKEPTLIENQVPALNSLKEKVEGLKKVEEVKKAEQPQLNHGDWSKSKDADENSETEGKAPPGTEAIEPVVPKRQPRKYNRKTKKRNARKSNR